MCLLIFVLNLFILSLLLLVCCCVTMFFFLLSCCVMLWTECTKIAHRLSLAILTADEGIAGNSATRTVFTHFLRRRNRGSIAIFFAEEIAHFGASKNRAILGGAVKIAAATAENRAILVLLRKRTSRKKGIGGKPPPEQNRNLC